MLVPRHQRRHRAVAARPRPAARDPRELPLAARRRLRPHRRRAAHGLHPRRRPGERILVPLEVVAPPEPGRYLLEVDLVHEDVRWFEQGCRVEIEVAEALARSRPSPAAASSRRRRRGGLRRPRLLIPRVLHRVWVGAAEMPAAHVEFGRGFERLHPELGDAPVDGRRPRARSGSRDAERGRARSASELSNLVRYEVLRRARRRLRRHRRRVPAAARRPAARASRRSPRSSCPAASAPPCSAPSRGTGSSSARPGCRARRSGWGRTRPTRTARTS